MSSSIRSGSRVRQARGVLFYKEVEIRKARAAALETQRALDVAQGKPAKTLRKAAKEKLSASHMHYSGCNIIGSTEKRAEQNAGRRRSPNRQ